MAGAPSAAAPAVGQGSKRGLGPPVITIASGRPFPSTAWWIFVVSPRATVQYRDLRVQPRPAADPCNSTVPPVSCSGRVVLVAC